MPVTLTTKNATRERQRSRFVVCSPLFIILTSLALLSVGGCPHDTSRTNDPTDASSDAIDLVDDVDTSQPLTIENLVIIENPANILSCYIEWQSSEAVVTDLSVDCGTSYTHRFEGSTPTENHSVFVMGLFDGANCRAEVTAEGGGQSETALTTFDVGPLPDELPRTTLVTVTRSLLQTGWTLTNLTNRFDGAPLYAAIFDELGRYRWYHRRARSATGADNAIRSVPEGVLIGGSTGLPAVLINWEGRLLWEATFGMHHDIRPATEPEHYLYLGRTYDYCPEANAGTLNEVDASTDETIWGWPICDHFLPDPIFNDWSHLNAIEPFPAENAVLLSSRNTHALFKVDLDTEEVVWVLGLGTKMYSGFDGDFEIALQDRFYRQHAPEILPNGDILLFDNGYPNFREYSRAIQIQYDEELMTAEVVWEYRHEPDVFADIWGDADRLSNGNTLITYGLRTEDGDLSRYVEVTDGGDVAWELTLPPRWGTYRAERLVEPPLGYVVEQ